MIKHLRIGSFRDATPEGTMSSKERCSIIDKKGDRSTIERETSAENMERELAAQWSLAVIPRIMAVGGAA